MGRFKNCIIWALVGINIVTCNKYEFPQTPYPRLETIEVTDISQTGATFRAHLTDFGSQAIVDHGFIWSLSENFIQENDKIQLGEISGSSEFNGEINHGLYKDNTYFVKSYVTTSTYQVFGNVVAFVSKGSKPPIISRFSPTMGKSGDTVTLTGKNFSSTSSRNKVKFGTIESQVVFSNDSTIVCTVPQGIVEKSVFISLSIAGNQGISPIQFILE